MGSGGHVTGIDLSTSLIEDARRRAEGRNLPVSFEEGDVQALRFENDTFDAVRTVAEGTLSGDEADLWWTDLAQASRDGNFLYGVTAFIVAGTKR